MVCIFKLFRILFLSPEHLRPWTEYLYHVVFAGANYRFSARIADHPVVFVCVISCIKHHTPCTIRNLFDHLPEHRRVVRPSLGNCTGYDLSSLYVGNYVQFDEFTSGCNTSLGILHSAYLIMAIPVASPSSDPRAWDLVCLSIISCSHS